MERLRKLAILRLLLACTVGTAAYADAVLEQVPRDALGLIVVRNLSESDAKTGKLLSAVGSRMPGLVALLKSIAGLDAGLDQRRDLMVVLLPPQNNSRQFHLAVWLPVRDYDALVRSLDGDPGREIAAVTLAGEDLLVVQQDDWAVVMDSDQRDRLELLHEAKPSPPQQLAEWSPWIGTFDAAVVVLPAGMRAGWAWAAQSGLLQVAPAVVPPAPHDDDLFGPGNRPAPPLGWQAVRQSIRTALTTAPELTRWAAEAEGIACGLRLDDDGNALVGVRLAVSPDALAAALTAQPSRARAEIPQLDQGGPFVVAGSGRVSPYWIKPLVAPYVRQQLRELMTEYQGQVPPEDVSNFCRSVEAAVMDVAAFSVLTRPGAGGDGVYTNSFLALRVASSEQFLATAGKLVDEWNATVGKVDALRVLAFDSRAIAVAGKSGREHAIDMTAAAGGPPLPEIKASMEKLFGPGGKFRVQFVPIDDTTVLLAAANESQVADVLNAMDGTTPGALAGGGLQPTTELFGSTGEWQLFFSPSGYTQWLRRQMDAILGAVIGGPVVPQFPESPPIGVAGGVDERILWTEVAVPVETLRAFAKFSRK